MDVNQKKIQPGRLQLPLFVEGESSTNGLELFPEVWRQMEALTNPDGAVRIGGMKALQNMGAARVSPLIAYLVATRLNDPVIDARCQAITILAAIFRLDDNGLPAPEAVRYTLANFLNQMRTRWIYSLVQARLHDPALGEEVITLIRHCSYGGNHLSAIVNERKAPLQIRQAAAQLIGEAGFLAAQPALEKIALRLAARINGQQSMSFIAPDDFDDAGLLPVVNQALGLLQSD